jgi:hypothetical protein
MSTERRLVEALSEFESVEPAPDLFRRVEVSVAEDLVRRRRVARWIGGVAVGISTILLAVASVSSVTPLGVLAAPGWSIAIAESLVLFGVIVVFGPLMRRFGAVFVEDVFGGATEGVGRAFLQLLDVAYYLIFFGYIVLTTPVEGLGQDRAMTVMLESSLPRLGGILLLMGVTHAVTLTLLPVIGLIHASTVRAHQRARAGEELSSTPGAATADRVVRIILWITGSVAGLLVFALAIQIFLAVVFGAVE